VAHQVVEAIPARNSTAKLAPAEIIIRQMPTEQHCLTSHHKLQVLVHWEKAPA
jgi:hypothetical protein